MGEWSIFSVGGVSFFAFLYLFLFGGGGGDGSTPTSSLSCFFRPEENTRLDNDIEMILGECGSIGLLILTSGSAEDRSIPEGPPHVAGPIPGLSGFSALYNITNPVESSGR